VLDLPAGAVVLYAELLWGGNASGDDISGDDVDDFIDGAVTFVTPAATHQVSPAGTTDYDEGSTYARSAVVTSLIAGAGTYRVGAVPASLNGDDDMAGWTLIVVYRQATLPVRNMTVFTIGERVANND